MDNENGTELMEQNSDFADDKSDSLEVVDVKAQDNEPEVIPLRRLTRREYFQLTLGAYMALLPALLVVVFIFVIMFVIVRFVW
ncbi:MAG: hypothetical protein FWC13_07815 [Oscillospiraceae bacterium]|nr:hypothetical protein [Oscillospiraceae bacterium]